MLQSLRYLLPQIIIYIPVLRKSWSIKTQKLRYKYLALLFIEASSSLFFIQNKKLNMHSSKVEVAGQKCFSWCRSLVKDSGTILNTVSNFKRSLVISTSVQLLDILLVILFTEHFPLHVTSPRNNTDSDALSTNSYFLKKY